MASGRFLRDASPGPTPFHGDFTRPNRGSMSLRDPVQPTRLVPRVPPRLIRFCLECLQKLKSAEDRSAGGREDAETGNISAFSRGEPMTCTSGWSDEKKLVRWTTPTSGPRGLHLDRQASPHLAHAVTPRDRLRVTPPPSRQCILRQNWQGAPRAAGLPPTSRAGTSRGRPPRGQAAKATLCPPITKPAEIKAARTCVQFFLYLAP